MRTTITITTQTTATTLAEVVNDHVTLTEEANDHEQHAFIADTSNTSTATDSPTTMTLSLSSTAQLTAATPDLDGSSVSSAGCGSGSGVDGHLARWEWEEEQGGGNNDNDEDDEVDNSNVDTSEEDDSFISCTLHSTDSEHLWSAFDQENDDDDDDLSSNVGSRHDNDIPWDETLAIKDSNSALHAEQTKTSPQSVVVVVYPPQHEHQQGQEPQLQLEGLKEEEIESPKSSALLGQRRKRVEQIQSVCLDKKCLVLPSLQSCDASSAVFAGCYPYDSAFDDHLWCNMCPFFWKYNNHSPDEICRSDPNLVTVAVEATAICPRDVQIPNARRDRQKESYPKTTTTPAGSNFVGLVTSCSAEITDRYGIAKGTRVASLVRWGGNARYVQVSPDSLFRVPQSLDSADIASLISSHLPAFQALHHGRSRPSRYSTSCLRGQRVLIAAHGATLEVQALIRLARYAGASEIYVSVPTAHYHVLRRHRCAVLSDDPDDWLSVVRGSMDVVIDYAFPRNFTAIRASLAHKGRLICIAQAKPPSSSNFAVPATTQWNYVLERYHLSLMKRATLFDFKEYMEQFRPLVFDDTAFLLSLLATRKIRPHVDRFITLQDVPNVQNEIRSNQPLEGAIICEPWKE